MNRYALSIAICLLATGSSIAQPKPSIEGVWKVTEWIESGKTNTHPQPGLVIFSRRYYSVALLMAPRDASIPLERGRQLTDAERIELFEQWKWFVGISGSYELRGSAVVLHPIVAKEAADMNSQTPHESEYALEGSNTLWLTPKGATRVGLRMKLTRLE